MDALTDFHLALAETESFLKADLSISSAEELAHAERLGPSRVPPKINCPNRNLIRMQDGDRIETNQQSARKLFETEQPGALKYPG
jgi:hypothetical protein